MIYLLKLFFDLLICFVFRIFTYLSCRLLIYSDLCHLMYFIIFLSDFLEYWLPTFFELNQPDDLIYCLFVFYYNFLFDYLI